MPGMKDTTQRETVQKGFETMVKSLHDDHQVNGAFMLVAFDTKADGTNEQQVRINFDVLTTFVNIAPHQSNMFMRNASNRLAQAMAKNELAPSNPQPRMVVMAPNPAVRN